MTDYANDPDVMAFSRPKSAADLIPTNAPKSKMSGIRPELQYSDYENDPDILAFAPTKKKEEKTSSPVHQMIMKHLEERQKAQEYFLNKIGGVVEPALSAVTGSIAAPLGSAFGAINTMISPKFGTQEALKKGQDVAANIQQAFTYQPRTEAGKANLETVGKIGEAIGTPLPELAGFAPLAAPALSQTKGMIPKVRVEKVGKAEVPIAPPLTSLQSAGSAAVAPIAEAKAALADLPAHMQESLANVDPSKLSPTDLKVIKNHKKFAKFGMLPTEAEALEDTTLMSEERNARAKDLNLQARFEERDPKLIQAFNNIKEKIAPDVFETDPIRLASMPLDKLKADYTAHQSKIAQAYEIANKAAGESQSPIDVGALRENIINGLKEKQRTRYVPPRLQADLDEVLSKGYMTPEEYENFRTDTATIARTSKDPLESQAAYIIRDKLEQVPIKDEFAQYKPLYDAARNEVKALKEKEKIPAYKAAISDTRTADEIEAGLPHPAANNFVANHYSSKTAPLNVERLVQLIGRDSPEHQALNKLKIDEFKLNSGIRNDKGTVSQANLNKQIYHQHASHLPYMFGNETTQTLQDLADVANLSEHTKGVHHVNTSNTEVLREKNAINAAKETISSLGASAAEQAINAKTGIGGTVLRNVLKGRNERLALEAEQKALAELSQRRLSPTAGIRNLSDLGKTK